MDEQGVRVELHCTEEQAEALAEMVKRIGLGALLELSKSEEEAYLMLQGCEQLRRALADAGYAPR